MVSLVSIVVNLFREGRPVQVRRMPPRKVLRAHLLGLSNGLFAALLVIVFWMIFNDLCLVVEEFCEVFIDSTLIFKDPADLNGLSWIFIALYVIIFALGSRSLGAFFVIFIALNAIFADISRTSSPEWWLWVTMSQWYIAGYLFGAIFATLYNDLVFLHLITIRRDLVKIAFAFDPAKILNIIKSPIKDEVTVPVDRKRRLYDYKPDPVPDHPYTIAFIANPNVLHRDNSLVHDPIIDNLELFLRSVDRALFSLETDEVLGRPEIWSRVRVVVIFDPYLADRCASNYTMLQASRDGAVLDGEAAENLLDPREEMSAIYKDILDSQSVRAQHTSDLLTALKNETDVIFAMSASAEYDRSTAHYADWVESLQSDPKRTRDGKDFIYDPDPNTEYPKGDEISVATCNDDHRFTCRHEYYSCFPGRIALNVLGASLKTHIHEFGHAMSCAFHGAIVDEYADIFEVKDVEITDPDPPSNPFYVNRIDRNVDENRGLISVHRVFAQYNGVEYFSDLYHPSGEENWIGYFPARESLLGTCTMDRNYSIHQFDKLISVFMYDRLVAKINRPERNEDECEDDS